MADRPLRFFIMGTGVVGQYFGAKLHRAGHEVTFLTRPESLDRYRRDGIALEPAGAEPHRITDCGFTASPEGLEEQDYVFACFRAEQKDDVPRLLQPFKPRNLVVCFPAWREDLAELSQHAEHVHYVLPGLAGVYRNGGIYFEEGTTKAGPVLNTPLEETARLSAVLNDAGARTRVKATLVTWLQSILAVGMPFLASLGPKNYRLANAMAEPALCRLAADAQQEAVAVLRAEGQPIGAAGRLLAMTPPGLLAAMYRLAPLLVRGHGRTMIEVHFRKVHAQTVYLLRRLLENPAAERVHTEHLRELVERASSAPTSTPGTASG